MFNVSAFVDKTVPVAGINITDPKINIFIKRPACFIFCQWPDKKIPQAQVLRGILMF